MVARVADLDERVLVAAALAAVERAPDEVEQHEVAGVRLALLLDRVVARRLLAHPIDLLQHVLVSDLRPSRRDAQALPVGQLDERQGLEDGLEAHGLALFELHLFYPGRSERLQAPAVELVEDDLVDDRFRRLAEDLVLEALLDDLERHLAGTEAGQLHPAGQILGTRVDLLLDPLAFDLEGERLPDRRFLDVVDFQGRNLSLLGVLRRTPRPPLASRE